MRKIGICLFCTCNRFRDPPFDVSRIFHEFETCIVCECVLDVSKNDHLLSACYARRIVSINVSTSITVPKLVIVSRKVDRQSSQQAIKDAQTSQVYFAHVRYQTTLIRVVAPNRRWRRAPSSSSSRVREARRNRIDCSLACLPLIVG